jgi:uncharacterized membrane protein YbaN (DUF454 family)
MTPDYEDATLTMGTIGVVLMSLAATALVLVVVEALWWLSAQ